MKRLICYIIFTCFCVLNTWAQTYDDYVEKSLNAIEADSLLAAENYIRQAIEAEPDNPINAMLLSNLGTIQRRRRQYEQALDSYTQALHISPNSIPILLNRATVYLELSKNGLAKQDYSAVIALRPNHEEALLMRAYILMSQKNYEDAKKDYETLLQNNPLHFNAKLGLATLLQKMAHYDEAHIILTGMITQASDDDNVDKRQLAMLYVARAGVENDLKHVEQALLDLELAIKLDKNFSDAYLLRGQIYLALKRGSLAKKDFEQCVKLGIPMAEMRELIRQCE